MDAPLHVGETQIKIPESTVQGQLVEIDGETFYKIANYDLMRPFFMSIVSDTNHWMFIGSNGGLTAGRKNSEFALFPYYTDDKIMESNEITGSKTVIKIMVDGVTKLWEPFSERYTGLYNTSRNLYKNIYGNKIIFEEVNNDLGLGFRYAWNSTNRFGFVKHSQLITTGKQPLEITVLDGLQNIIPYGVTTDLQNLRSNLVDAYKKNELYPETGLGVYALSAIIVDRAEPSEALKANVVWGVGIHSPVYLCSSRQVENFRKGVPISGETEVKGEKGAYFLLTTLTVKPDKPVEWHIMANVNQGPADIANLNKALKKPASLLKEVLADVQQGTNRLKQLVASADGMQFTRDRLRATRHFSNVLYNIMRGGVIDHNYVLEKEDFIPYLEKANKAVFKKNIDKVALLTPQFNLEDLRSLAAANVDPDFRRLCLEYLPLKFSRRHGDPSRPWNKFSINTQSEKDGSKILDYEGNWRDIFQNWEALAHSFPEFIDGMIFKFLNASTFEGYNPYRVTKGGFDWEVIEPDDPWSYIGYWGDHQVIYLLKFLEFIEDYFPSRLAGYWSEELFVYANVPYRIKPYRDIVENPKDTINFDQDLDTEIRRRREDIGADGALLQAGDGSIYHVNLAEKLLATLLAKCSNFIPGAGIWLNTQRPEWNDANNALVGNGVSMVTLYYLYRFLNYLERFLGTVALKEVPISTEMYTQFQEIGTVLRTYENLLTNNIAARERREITDALGSASGKFRETIYSGGFSGVKVSLAVDALLDFIRLMKAFASSTIDANKRPDNLYHAYNLVEFTPDKIAVSHLDEMLEGQVAVISSGYLQPSQVLRLMDSLGKSALYRKDQNSFILYPDKTLPRFLEKNIIEDASVHATELLPKLLEDGNNDIIDRDLEGRYHFNGAFNNAAVLEEALENLPEQYQHLAVKEKDKLLNIYEAVFNHRAFTGRSGTFFGYEGLGSIYWHMVSKLALAVMETVQSALEHQAGTNLIKMLSDHYHRINDGIGAHKSPELYGAFPTDPYSHTPAHRGAQQPGMTGQVKEDILCRMAELGVRVKDGQLCFGRGIFKNHEYLDENGEFEYFDVQGSRQHIPLMPGSFGFTICQTPVVYIQSERPGLKVFLGNEQPIEPDHYCLGAELSTAVFRRDGSIRKIEVYLKK